MTELREQIQRNINAIKSRITAAAVSAGRDPHEVRLIVVTKGQPIQVIEAALQAGVTDLGENYPEETQDKIIHLKPLYPATWHMIGHLQSRKSAIVAQHFDYYQSLDRLEIAQRLNQQLTILGRRLPVLLEINTGGEISKGGWDATNRAAWSDLTNVIYQISNLPNLEIRGLMTMPPLSTDPEAVRPCFALLRQLRDKLRDQMPALSLPELSMGTSSDFEIAVQEGATMVRIGTAILGPRPPKKT